MPWANQLVTTWLAAPEPISRSPSVEVMLRQAGEVLPAVANELPDQRHRRARHGRAADADGGAVRHEGGSLGERNHLLAQAAVAPGKILAQARIGRHLGLVSWLRH